MLEAPFVRDARSLWRALSWLIRLLKQHIRDGWSHVDRQRVGGLHSRSDQGAHARKPASAP